MKTCACCFTVSSDDPGTCPSCGNASWVAAEAPKPARVKAPEKFEPPIDEAELGDD